MIEREIAELHLAVAARAGAPEAVEFEQPQSPEQHGTQCLAVPVDVQHFYRDREIEDRTGGHALGLAGMLGYAFDTIDQVLGLDLDQKIVRSEAHPRRPAASVRAWRLRCL